MPAKAGIQSSQSGSDGKAWIPAFAGMTVNSSYRFIYLQTIALGIKPGRIAALPCVKSIPLSDEPH